MHYFPDRGESFFKERAFGGATYPNIIYLDRPVTIHKKAPNLS